MLGALVALAPSGYAVSGHAVMPVQPRVSSISCDADRCYYGYVDEEGGVSGDAIKKKVRSGPVPKPNPNFSPNEMVDAQFQMLSEGAVEDAYAFISPQIIQQYNME